MLQLRRLSPQISRLEDAPAEICALLANLADLGLTHTRRSEEQVALDQFSTPPQLGALAVLAAQIRPGDQVLEPSAGTGLLAVLAEACGGQRDPERDRRSTRRDPGGTVSLGGSQRPRRPASERHPARVRQLPRGRRQPALPGAGRPPACRPRHPGRRRAALGDRADAAVRGCRGHAPSGGAGRGRPASGLPAPRLRQARNLRRDRTAGCGPGPGWRDRTGDRGRDLGRCGPGCGRRAAAPERPAPPVPGRLQRRHPGAAGPGPGDPIEPPCLSGDDGARSLTRPRRGRARDTMSASTRPTGWAASAFRRAVPTPPRSWNLAPWPRSRRRRRPTGRSCPPRSPTRAWSRTRSWRR